MFIYKITNNINGKIYIGQTTRTIKERWKCHCRKKGTHSILNHAINKYGRGNFLLEQIDTANSIDELNSKEIYWIKFYDCLSPNGYNITAGGENKVFTEQHKLKLSEAKLGKKYGKRSLGSGDNISLGRGSKKFKIMSIDDKILGYYFNQSACARDFNLNVSKISACLLKKRKTHKQYKFEFAEEC